jgi:hypothetical protein
MSLSVAMALSVLLPQILFKAALVSLNNARLCGRVDPEPVIQPIKALLGCLGRDGRLQVGNRYRRLFVNHTK